MDVLASFLPSEEVRCSKRDPVWAESHGPREVRALAIAMESRTADSKKLTDGGRADQTQIVLGNVGHLTGLRGT